MIDNLQYICTKIKEARNPQGKNGHQCPALEFSGLPYAINSTSLLNRDGVFLVVAHAGMD